MIPAAKVSIDGHPMDLYFSKPGWKSEGTTTKSFQIILKFFKDFLIDFHKVKLLDTFEDNWLLPLMH